MKFNLKQLEEKSKKRPQGFFKEILKNSLKINEEEYEISSELYHQIDKEYRLPARIEMFKSAVGAAKDLLSSDFNDIKRRTSDELNFCIETCSNCNYLIESQMRCGKCGCFLKFKIQLTNWRCPLKKW